MAHLCNARRRILQSRAIEFTEYVWLSDEILANCWRRFTHIALVNKRNGSSVPGPLEATRRLARRRMVGLASSEGHSASEAGLIFPLERNPEPRMRWEAPSSVLPQWIGHDAMWPLNSQKQTADARLPQLSPLEGFKARLYLTHQLEDVKRLWHDTDMGTFDIVQASQLAFRHVVQWASAHCTMQFLLDSKLNVAGAANLSTVIIRSSTAGLTKAQYRSLITVVKDSLTHGIITSSELRTIIAGLPLLIASVFPDVETQHHALANAYQVILHSVFVSNTKGLCSTHPAVLRSLLERCSALPTRHQSKVLRTYMTLVAWPFEEVVGLPTTDKSLAFWMRQLGSGLPLVSPVHGQSFSQGTLIDTLNSLPPTSARRHITLATKAILDWEPVSAHKKEFREKTLNLWLDSLKRSVHGVQDSICNKSMSKDVYDMLAVRIEPALIAPHLSSLDALDVMCIILRHWFCRTARSRLERTSGHYLSDTQAEEILGRFRNLGYSESGSLDLMSLVNILVALSESRTLFPPFQHEIFTLTRKIFGPEALLNLVLQLRKRRVWIYPDVLAFSIQAICDRHPAIGLRLFGCSRAVPIEQCSKLPITLVRQGVTHPRHIMKLIGRLPQKKSEAEQKQHTAFMNDLLHNLATEFAFSGKGSSRLAFRNVHRCYRYLRDRGQPVQLQLVKALVHAGVTRPLQRMEWVSTMKFRWIVKLVRETEGIEVADRLDSLAWRWRGRVTFNKSGTRAVCSISGDTPI